MMNSFGIIIKILEKKAITGPTMYNFIVEKHLKNI